MVHHSEAIQCLVKGEEVIHQVLRCFLSGQDFVHISQKGVFYAVVIVVVRQLCQLALYGLVVQQLYGDFGTFGLHLIGQSPVIVVLAALVIALVQQPVDSVGSLAVDGGDRLQHLFLALLLHDGVVVKVAQEVAEKRASEHDEFQQDIRVGKYAEVHGVIADTPTGDGIDLYVGFQEAQAGELLDDDFRVRRIRVSSSTRAWE